MKNSHLIDFIKTRIIGTYNRARVFLQIKKPMASPMKTKALISPFSVARKKQNSKNAKLIKRSISAINTAVFEKDSFSSNIFIISKTMQKPAPTIKLSRKD